MQRLMAWLLLFPLMVACGAFDKTNPPPNPVAEANQKSIENFTKLYCTNKAATDEEKAMVRRIRLSVIKDGMTTEPGTEADCNEIGRRVVETRTLKLKISTALKRKDGQPEVQQVKLDFKPIAVFTTLLTLSTIDQNLDSADLEVLAPLTELTHLNISRNPALKDISPIAENHRKLVTLHATHIGIGKTQTDLTALADLKELLISNTPNLTEIPALPANIKTLVVTDTPMSNAVDLKKYTKLETINLAANKLAIAPEIPKSVTSLDLYRNPIEADQFAPLWNLSQDGDLNPKLKVTVGLGIRDLSVQLLTDLRRDFANAVKFVSPDVPENQEAR